MPTTGDTTPRTVPALIRHAAQRHGDKAVLLQKDGLPQPVSISYRELDLLRMAAARAFHAAGIRKGDRVAVWAPNIPEWIVAAIGAQTLGAILVPLNTRMKGSEAADIINRSGARLLFTVAEFAAGPATVIRYPELIAAEDMPKLEAIVLLNGEAAGMTTWSKFLALGRGVADADIEAIAATVTPDDAMDMLFTSGTTGKPKGVVCCHSQNIQVFETWADTVGLRADDNYLIINPFFHTFGYKAGWLAAIIKGCRILPVISFDLDRVLKQIAADRVTMIPGPPTIYQMLLAHPDREKYDLSSLRLAVTGAAAVPVELVKKMRSELHFQTVVTAYGLTESSGVVTICRPDDDPETIATTSGRAIPGVEVRCVDGSGNEVPRGEPGEIWVRGYNVMKEYFDNPQATRETITPEGWLRTGDIGVMDARGYIRITDRLKDMYISGGFNVYPAEIENALASIGGVAQSAVVGVPDDRMGEVGKAFIVRKAGSELTSQQVIDYCKANLANYKVPRAVEFLDAMPLNAAGKILKTALRGR
jgi:acyl-CoA synthetase (AMP-forming)/AMP-acid ligase II